MLAQDSCFVVRLKGYGDPRVIIKPGNKIFSVRKKDIENRKDITRMVRSFYEKLLREPEFEHIFLQVAKVDILEHIDMIVDFWESAVFHTGMYKRNTLETHVSLHMKYPLKDDHFKKWLEVFEQNIDDIFEGENVETAKLRARSIAGIMKMKINNLDRLRLEINN